MVTTYQLIALKSYFPKVDLIDRMCLKCALNDMESESNIMAQLNIGMFFYPKFRQIHSKLNLDHINQSIISGNA